MTDTNGYRLASKSLSEIGGRKTEVKGKSYEKTERKTPVQILFQLGLWWIRIKESTMVRNKNEALCFQEPSVLFGGLNASP